MKKLLLSLIIGILLVGTISAIDWDNVKSYDEVEREYTITNAFGLGETLAKIKLLTSEEYQVIDRGDGVFQIVAEVEFKEWTNLENSLGGIETYLLPKWEEDNREIIYKYKAYKDAERIVYESYRYFDEENGYYVSGYREIGIEEYEEEYWIEFTDVSELPLNPQGDSLGVIISLWADVKPNERVEWIPYWYGERLDEWAIWSSSFNTGLKAYWTMNESTPLDTVDGLYNLTTTVPITQVGLINDSRNFLNDAEATATNSNVLQQGNFTWSVWFNATDGGFNEIVTSSDKVLFGTYNNGHSAFYTNDGGGWHQSATAFVQKNFTHLVVTFDGYNLTIYQNGLWDGSWTEAFSWVKTNTLTIGKGTIIAGGMENVDELAMWNRTLSASEINDLYNGGLGLTYDPNPTPPDSSPTITLNSPADNYNISTNSITFNYTAEDDINVANVTLYINGVANTTTIHGTSNSTNIATTLTFVDGNYNWSVDVYDNASQLTSSATRLFSIDITDPVVNIVYPTSDISSNYVTSVNTSSVLNWTSSDTNLATCWVYNISSNTNVTTTCGTNISMVIPYGINIFRVYANDTFGNEATDSETINFTYKVLENGLTHNTTSYESSPESFNINVTKGSGVADLTASFWYNGTKYTPTETDNTASSTFRYSFSNIPLLTTANVGENRSVVWEILADGVSLNKTTTQNILPINLTSCATGNKYLNVTFKDEATLTNINASIPTSTFVYGLGDLSKNRSLTFINNTDNFNYTFCFEPHDRNVTSDTYIQYKQGTAYPQRTYDLEGLIYQNTTTDLVLYLLSSSDGIYVTFQVKNSADQVLEGVEVNGTRVISGSDVIVAQGTTDAAGSVTFWLNPDFSHTFVFDKTGYDPYTYVVIPTQSSYTITLGSDTSTSPDYTQGISYSIKPADDFLDNGTIYSFNFTTSSSYWELQNFGFILYNNTGDSIGTGSSTAATGGTVNVNVDTSVYTSIYMDYYYSINSTQFNGTRTWIIQDTTGRSYSITHFFSDLTTYIDAGFFGFDDFGKALLSFLILVMVAGGLSYKYGLNSDAAIMGVIFGVVLFLDVGIGLIPNPSFAGLNPLPNLITTITGILLIGMLIREEMK